MNKTNNKQNEDLHEIEQRLDAIKNILHNQSPQECRSNVWETIDLLKKELPDYSEYIQNQLDTLIKEEGIDFFTEIRQSPEKEESNC